MPGKISIGVLCGSEATVSESIGKKGMLLFLLGVMNGMGQVVHDGEHHGQFFNPFSLILLDQHF